MITGYSVSQEKYLTKCKNRYIFQLYYHQIIFITLFTLTRSKTYLVHYTPLEMDELEALLVEFGILDDDSKHADIIGKTAAEAAAK